MARNFFQKNERGFILIGMMLSMVVLAVPALSMNRRSAMHVKISANHKANVQRYLGQLAGIEQGIWKLTGQPNWRSGRYADLTFDGLTDTITTTAGDFLGDGLKVGEQIVIANSIPYNDGTYTIQSFSQNNCFTVISNTLQISGGAGSGKATIAALSKGMNEYGDLTFTSGLNCSNDTIASASGNFSTDGFKRGDRIAIVNSSPNNDGVYTILNDVSSQPNTIRVANNSLQAEGTGNGKIAVMRGEPYVYKGFEYERTVQDSYICGTGNFISISVIPPYAQKAVSDLIKINTWRNFYIADMANHRIREVDTSADMITTAAGNSTLQDLLKPGGVCIDTMGNIYIADTENHIIRKIHYPGTLIA